MNLQLAVTNNYHVHELVALKNSYTKIKQELKNVVEQSYIAKVNRQFRVR